MPRISAFYGIVITMYSNDHLPPHFHARYGEYEAQVSIATGEAIAGALPPRCARLAREWASLHGDELVTNWTLAQERRPLVSIDPLP